MLTFMRREMTYGTSFLLAPCCAGLGYAAKKEMSSVTSIGEPMASSSLAHASTESMSARILSLEFLQDTQIIMPAHRQLVFPDYFQLSQLWIPF